MIIPRRFDVFISALLLCSRNNALLRHHDRNLQNLHQREGPSKWYRYADMLLTRVHTICTWSNYSNCLQVIMKLNQDQRVEKDDHYFNDILLGGTSCCSYR
jgi:hypothetical protein